VSSQSPPTSPSTTKIASFVVIAVGALLMIGAVFADPIGLSGGGDGFGWKQLIAAIVGLVIPCSARSLTTPWSRLQFGVVEAGAPPVMIRGALLCLVTYN
jgi:hypothetical protein